MALWVLAEYNNLSVTVQNYSETTSRPKFSCKLTLTLVKNNFKIMTSAKPLSCRHLLTPANIKYTTDVGKTRPSPSSPTTSEISRFYRRTYTLSLCCKLITLVSFLNIFFCWYVYTYKEIKLAQKSRSENVDMILLQLQYGTGKLEEQRSSNLVQNLFTNLAISQANKYTLFIPMRAELPQFVADSNYKTLCNTIGFSIKIPHWGQSLLQKN